MNLTEITLGNGSLRIYLFIYLVLIIFVRKMFRVSFYLLTSKKWEKLNKFNLLGKDVQQQIGKPVTNFKRDFIFLKKMHCSRFCFETIFSIISQCWDYHLALQRVAGHWTDPYSGISRDITTWVGCPSIATELRRSSEEILLSSLYNQCCFESFHYIWKKALKLND